MAAEKTEHLQNDPFSDERTLVIEGEITSPTTSGMPSMLRGARVIGPLSTVANARMLVERAQFDCALDFRGESAPPIVDPRDR